MFEVIEAIEAILHNDIEKIKKLINNAKDENGRTPLHYASYNGYLGIAKLFIEHGADVNVKDKDGRTPLQLASMRGHIDVVKLLIDNNANINDKDDYYGYTPLHLACAYSCNIELVKFLLEHGADVNIKDENGSTPLHKVSRFGYIEIVKLFIEHGADMNARDRDDKTPLYYASEKGHDEIVKLLKDFQFKQSGDDKLTEDYINSFNEQ